MPTNARCNFLKPDEADLHAAEQDDDDDEVANGHYETVGLESIDFSPWVNEVGRISCLWYSNSPLLLTPTSHHI